MKIMKKSFSFVCCLFLAVSCFATFAAASDPSKQVVAVKGGAVIGRIVEHTKVTEHTRVIEFVGIYSAVNAGRLPGVGERATVHRERSLALGGVARHRLVNHHGLVPVALVAVLGGVGSREVNVVQRNGVLALHYNALRGGRGEGGVVHGDVG